MRRSKIFWFSILGMLLCLVCALGAAAAPVAQSTPSAPSSPSSPSNPSNPSEQFIFDARADLELLADKVLTAGVRPPEWKANTDVKSPTVVSDLWFDNELLANAIFGPNQRPDGWIGATVPVDLILARNVRHDLEQSADQVYGKGQRPTEWRGAAKIVTCDRTLQNVISLLDKYYNVQSKTPESALNYCLTVDSEIEDDLVNIVYGTPDSSGNVTDPISELSGVRGDLERLADELLGLNTRPDHYIGNRDTTSTSFISDIRLDLELLADTRLGVGKRPAGWIGRTSNSPAVSYLNLRHDLELLADTTMGIGKRPHGWQGTNPVQRCDPLVQNLSFLDSQSFKDYDISNIDQTALDYCAQVAAAANNIVENPPKLDVVAEDNMKLASSNYAFAYLDVGATQYMGIMPGGISFRALYRNFGDSSMMFVQGDDFALYVDMHFTTVSETAFRSLPTLQGVDPLSFCDAKWCNGPGPTPTPTGSGPLLSVLVGSAPVATPNIGALQSSKQLVSWNQVRVTYVFDDLAAKQAQVALEICPNGATNGAGCEPVASVFDKNTNASKPVASVFNGMNVFVFRYGYSTNLIIESDHYYSQDVWISDPTLR